MTLTRRTDKSFRPRLEALEDRRVPSAFYRQVVPGQGDTRHSYYYTGITAGPDGNIWFTLVGINHYAALPDANFVGRVTPDGTATTFGGLGLDSPQAITAGPDGNLWFAVPSADKIGQVTTGGVITEFFVPTAGSRPSGITAGPDGNLWFTESKADQIGRITPAGAVTEFSAGITPGSAPSQITLGPDGNLWFTEPGGNRIGRITPAGVVTEFSVPTADAAFGDITAGPDGNVWITEQDADRVARITRAGTVTEFPLARIGSRPLGITAGTDGNVWFTEAGTSKVGRVTPAGAIAEFPTARPDSSPSSITAGPDGNLWFGQQTPSTVCCPYVNVPPLAELVLRPDVVTGADAGGGPDVRVFDANSGQLLQQFFAYGSSFTGGVRVATGNIDPDGGVSIITAPGPGGGPDMRIYRSVSGSLYEEFFAYNTGFTGGVYLATADVNGDGVTDIITSPGPGGGPDIRVFDGKTLGLMQEFLAYDINFTGGVRVAVADVNGDGVPDLVTSPGPGGGPDVRVFDLRTKALLKEVIAYNPGFTGGVYVAAGDMDGDGKADLITAPGTGGGPDLRVFSGATTALLQEAMVYNPAFTGGVRVGVAPVNVLGVPEILTAPGPGGGPDVRAFVGNTLAPAGELFAYDIGFTGGVNLAGEQVQTGAPPQTLATFQEFTTPRIGTQPSQITKGPDGNVWFTEPGVNAIGRVTPAGTFTDFFLLTGDAQPYSITAGPDSNLWFTESRAGQIGRITPAGEVTEFPATPQPGDITAGPDGNLWFTDAKAGEIGRMTPAGSLTVFPIATPVSVPAGITVGPDGNLWFGEQGNGKIGRITTVGSITEFPLNSRGGPGSITTGPDGNLWFTVGNKVGRITLSGVATIYDIPTAMSLPSTITAGPDGNLWFTERLGNALGVVTPQGRVAEFSLPQQLTSPDGITVGPDGNLWFTAQPDTIGKLVLPAPLPSFTPLLVTGADAGSGPDVRVFNAQTGALVRQIIAYDPSFTGGVRVALGDVNHDNVPDIITAPGPGLGPIVRVFDGVTGALMREIVTDDPGFKVGLFVAAGDLNGDGKAEIVVGEDGLYSDVRIFDGASGRMTSRWLPYASNFLGGVRVAVGDVEGLGPFVITAPGAPGSPDIRVYFSNGQQMLQEFMAYDVTFTGGVYVSSADLNGDGIDEIITSPGPGRVPEVKAFDGRTGAIRADFLAYAPAFIGGLRVADLPNFGGDGKAAIVTAPGPGGGPDVRVFDGASQAQLDEFFAYDPAFTGGVYVGGQ